MRGIEKDELGMLLKIGCSVCKLRCINMIEQFESTWR